MAGMIHPENPHGATIPSFQTEGASQACEGPPDGDQKRRCGAFCPATRTNRDLDNGEVFS